MWKTQFEVNIDRRDAFVQQRNRSSSSSIIHSHSVPNSPNDIIRTCTRSSTANLEILMKNALDVPCSFPTNNDRTRLTSMELCHRNSYQTLNRHLSTIDESNDYEIVNDNESHKNEINVTSKDFVDDRYKKCFVIHTLHDSFLGTNTNYNQINIETNEETLETNKNHEKIESILDKSSYEFLQSKSQKLNNVCKMIPIFV